MKILVVDPSPLFLQAAHNFIASLPGCEAVLARSSDEALQQASAAHVDLVLLDYAERRAGGANLVHRIKSLVPPPMVVLLTPGDAAAYRTNCLRAGADASAAKDSLGSELPALVAGLALRARENAP